MQAFHFDDAVFTYVVSPEPVTRFSHHLPVLNGALTVSHTRDTAVHTAKNGDLEAVVIGLCIDSHGEVAREEIPAFILNHSQQNITAIYRLCNRFAGRYLILYKNSDGIYVIPDATSSMQVNYAFHGEKMCISSVESLAAEYFGYEISEYSHKIRSGANLNQGMPNDLTMYDEVKALLPNHYLDVKQHKAFRVKLDISMLPPQANLTQVIDQSDFLMKNITREYKKYYEIVCPLTSGFDSRLVFAYLNEAVEDLECYTFRHPGFTKETGDMWVPEKICEVFKKKYHVIDDLKAPEDYISAVKQITGPDFAESTIHLAYTFNSRFQGKALINGDIIGQLGKSVLGNTIPSAMASASYLLCKIHNREPTAKQEFSRYLDEIRACGETQYVFDLFAIENRCGRWANQTGMIYALCSINSLNIVNCRELILLWHAVAREDRVKERIHRELLNLKEKELAQLPFNPGEKYRFLKNHWIPYYFATYAKFYLSKLRRLK